MIEIYRLEEHGSYGDRTLQLFHHGWLKLGSDRGGIQLSQRTARELAKALRDWADEDEAEIGAQDD